MVRSGEGRKLRVAVLFGGQSDEHDVSLRSAQTVINALQQGNFEIVPIGITRSGAWIVEGDPMAALLAGNEPATELAGEAAASHHALMPVAGAQAVMGSSEHPIDVVLPVLHGPYGEDGTIQGLLDVAGVPYVGSGVLGSAVAMDKAMTKRVLTQAGVPQLPWELVTRRDVRDEPDRTVDRLVQSLGLPCFTKPANLGSSVGITRVQKGDELLPALQKAAFHDRRIVVEQGVDAREIEMSVLGNDDPIASVAGEIVPRGAFYDYDAKYVDDSTDLVIPAQLDAGVLERLQTMAIDAFRALDLAGLARVDFFVERSTETIYLNEVNTLPGFTSISMYPRLWEASGLPISELVVRLVDLALERHAERKR